MVVRAGLIPMLIDDYLPDYHVASRHQIDVHATPEVVYALVRRLDLSGSWLIRLLFGLRGLPTHGLTLDAFLEWGFALLDEAPGRELLLGLIGRFWTLKGSLQRVEPSAFRSFDQPGYARAAWTFYLTPQPSGSTLLVTETRVQCTDEAGLRRFRRYWRLVGPFSGVIRKEILRVIKREAEGG